ASLERAGSFAESLQPFRPDLATRAAMAGLTVSTVPRTEVRLTSWAQSRVLLTLRLNRNALLCDLRQLADLERAANGVAGEAVELNIDDFDASHVTGSDRRVTQRVSRWAHDSGYEGLLYPSRLGTAWTCCALFNRVRPRIINREPVLAGDADLLEVSLAFGIRVSSKTRR
ncbi:MAG TPA: RES family NAD+ phosphorylase, partial [Bauldia sp.]|nr:RES family NAD+ phosphorylase [Bauldia sp.]